MKTFIVLFLCLALTFCHIENFALQFVGRCTEVNNVGRCKLKSGPESVITHFLGNGGTEVEIQTKKGPVAELEFTFYENPVLHDSGVIRFGQSHQSLKDVLHFKSISANVIELSSKPIILTGGFTYNITGGEGVYKNAVGLVGVNSYVDQSQNGTMIVNTWSSIQVQ